MVTNRLRFTQQCSQDNTFILTGQNPVEKEGNVDKLYNSIFFVRNQLPARTLFENNFKAFVCFLPSHDDPVVACLSVSGVKKNASNL